MHRRIYLLLLLIVLRLLRWGWEIARMDADHVHFFPFCHEWRHRSSLCVDLLFHLRLRQFAPVSAFQVPIWMKGGIISNFCFDFFVRGY